MDADAFERCIAGGGVAVFGADTVYGLACDPDNAAAVGRLYALKGRATAKPSAVMFFDAQLAVAALPELGPRTRALHGAAAARRGDAAAAQPARALPARRWRRARPARARRAGAARGPPPVLQSSANVAGAPDARRLGDVPEAIRRAADLVLDAGELPGTPSTVVDLRRFEDAGAWEVVRAGAVAPEAVARAVSATA